MTKLALYVQLKAKPGMEGEVAEFLRSALPLVKDEIGTLSWYAIEEAPGQFAIFDTFNNEHDRQAHLDGQVAAALAAKASDLLSERPQIHKISILAAKWAQARAAAAAHAVFERGAIHISVGSGVSSPAGIERRVALGCAASKTSRIRLAAE